MPVREASCPPGRAGGPARISQPNRSSLSLRPGGNGQHNHALSAACARSSIPCSRPILCFALTPAEIRSAAARFSGFPGRALYAVKCNPNPFVLTTLFEAGITDFDVASINEVRLIDSLFGQAAGQFFNNPAKTRPAIQSASSEFGIRFYTVDCMEEVDKVLEEASTASELTIAVRISTAAKDARYVLSSKFGSGVDQAVQMLRHIHAKGVRAGLSFHVGSQCLAPQAFTSALSLVGKVAEKAGVPITVLNVGGGFPAPYPGDDVKSLGTTSPILSTVGVTSISHRAACFFVSRAEL